MKGDASTNQFKFWSCSASTHYDDSGSWKVALLTEQGFDGYDIKKIQAFRYIISRRVL